MKFKKSNVFDKQKLIGNILDALALEYADWAREKFNTFNTNELATLRDRVVELRAKGGDENGERDSKTRLPQLR